MTYTPQTWFDGAAGHTPLIATRLNAIEAGVAAVDGAASDLADRVTAIEAFNALGGDASTVAFGATANRPAPTLGAIFYDTTINSLLIGVGTGWKKADFTDLSGAGSSNAPQNFAAVVNPDSSITLTWTAVSGATSYKLYELRSPTGVAGATALTGTSTTRSPGSNGNYEYWLTATVSGVESAQSNHATATLPYGGSTFTGSPAQRLNLNGTGGYWNLGVGFSTGHQDIAPATLYGGYTNTPYFELNGAADAVAFQVFMNGATTSASTHYGRCELREYNSNSTTKAAWASSGSASHVMEYTFKLTHLQPLKPWVTIGQIHDTSSDALAIKVKGASTSALDVVATLYDTDQTTKLVSGYTIGDTVKIKIDLTNNSLKLYANDVLKITSSAMANKTGLYFKNGIYPQSHFDYGGFESPTEYCRAEIKNLTVTHSPAI